MKVTKQIGMDSKTIVSLENMSSELKISFNELVEKYCLTGLKLDSFFEVNCPCGAKYSSKLPCCPGCKALKPSD